MSDSRVTQVLCSDLDSCNVVQGNTVRKILVPFDNSSHSARSFGTALDMAKNRGASIVVISVIQEEIRKSWVNDTPTREKNMTKNSSDILKEGIRKLQKQAQNLGIGFDSTIVSSKSIAETIISFASTNKIDLVVMGTRGKGMPKEMMLGRVSTDVALNAHCPVLLVK
ncbi:MAG: universal stress protein [Nitrosopumilaceae archaeon]|nr:universal stress protein [Nitrosopumilaceae archaeon]